MNAEAVPSDGTAAQSPRLLRRARVHAALGDPARLAIVDLLCLGDAAPGELGRQLGLPSNLIAHHVKVLQSAGLLRRTRSEGDRRRSYLQLAPEALGELAPPALPAVRRVVFVCTHNSARSQLAAALWRKAGPTPATSAGTRPAARVHPRAVAIADRRGLELDPRHTAHVADVITDGDLVIAVCDNAHEELTGQSAPDLHWSVPDPVRLDTDAAFDAAYADLAGRVDRLAPAITPGDTNG
ncbi:arsenate reductase/protein-tyrosine-phosphatase family protein [Micromonospora sp. NBC_01813]|uniref:arsenate reductase/protein-tyrosine-phosphatase family protein n=1 Tax=Micromonospora sp. NBC_01813 TaxID=2975988 RepID=UPI002DD880C4|nr:helix-turn-helix domain-containing protein [Micromonospora sp. NBC_01813]WSA06541.1 helix-turn-helix domain-containing protein [Micromonospora sp. NBC_01813]